MSQRAIRVPEDLEKELAREAEERGKSVSAVTEDLLGEALRMRRATGIVFVDGPSGRRAVVAGSGLDVWEVIATWKQGGESAEALCQNYPWLTEIQRRAALRYYELYPAEIDARLAREREWTPEKVRRDLPSLLPRK